MPLITALELIAHRSEIPTDAAKLLREVVDYDKVRRLARRAGISQKEMDELLGE